MLYGIVIGMEWIHDSILPGIVDQKLIEHTLDSFVDEKLHLCKDCPTHGELCHVVEEGTGRKFCPVLFHDLVKPKWDLRKVNGTRPKTRKERRKGTK